MMSLYSCIGRKTAEESVRTNGEGAVDTASRLAPPFVARSPCMAPHIAADSSGPQSGDDAQSYVAVALVLQALSKALPLTRSWIGASFGGDHPSPDASPSKSSTKLDSEDLSSIVGVGQKPTPPKQCLLLLDWDDTLLPTTFLRQTPGAMALRPVLAAKLREHAALIEVLLRAAKAVAHVSMVTLSRRPWVLDSAARHLPGLNLPALLHELGIDVYYAQEESFSCPGALATEDWATLKRSAMARCLDDWLGSDSGNLRGPLSVVSIGDSPIEQQALKSLIGASAGVLPQKPFCKTVKLMEWPSLQQLGEEIALLPSWLPSIADHDKDFDLTIESPADLAAVARSVGLEDDLEISSL